MFHDDLINSDRSEFPLLKTKDTHVFYSDNDFIDRNLTATGYEFFDEGILDLPFDQCMFVMENLYEVPRGECHRGAVLVSRVDEDIKELGLLHNSSSIKTPDFVFAEFPEVLMGAYPYIGYLYRKSGIYNFEGEELRASFIAWNPAYKNLFEKSSQCAVAAVITTLMLMATKNVKKEKIDISEKLQKARSKKKKPPLSGYTVINLDGLMKKNMDGTHSSPRPHWRRGHIRTLQNGRKIPIPPTLINAELGEAKPNTYTLNRKGDFKDARSI